MLKLKSTRLNIEALLKIIILLGFSLFFFKSINSGTIKLFVHPRIVPYLKLGIVIMLIMILFLIKDIFNGHKTQGNRYQYLIFMVPLIMAFALPAKEVNLGTISFNNNAIEPSKSNLENNLSNVHEHNHIHKKVINNNSDDYQGNNYILKMQDNTIIMDETNFVKCVEEISNNPLKYVGKEITITGFVFKDSNFNSNEFVPARMMMTCCAADMSVIGLLARYSLASELKENTWFRFTGIIKNSEIGGINIPYINIKSAEKIKTPENEYVYPY